MSNKIENAFWILNMAAEVVASATETLRISRKRLDLSQRSLVKANKIVEVGAYTLGTDEKNMVVLQNTDEPEQFSQETVREIEEKCNFTNPFGQVEPVVWFYKDWYKRKILDATRKKAEYEVVLNKVGIELGLIAE